MSDDPTQTGGCDVCHEDVPTLDLVDHIRVMHPDLYEPVVTWPDGAPVIRHEVVEPSDFDGSGDDRG